jgi:hypothetical protein
MATKKKTAPLVKRADITVEARESESKANTIARLAGSPTFRAAVTERQFIGTAMGGSELNLFDVNDALTERFLKVTKEGDMTTPEAMLLAQAHTCEAIFHDFARRSLRSDTMPKLEAYMRMALKAQQQSASTLRILGEIKNPRAVSFVKQQNLGHNVQVNNGTTPPTVPRAHEESGDQSNKLLEHQHGEWLDTGAAGEAAGSDKAMATVGEVNRAEKR